MEIKEFHYLLAEKGALEKLLKIIPESDVIDRMSLESRKKKVEKQIKENYEITNRLSLP